MNLLTTASRAFIFTTCSQLEERMVAIQFRQRYFHPAIRLCPLLKREGPHWWQVCISKFILGKGEIRERAKIANKCIIYTVNPFFFFFFYSLAENNRKLCKRTQAQFCWKRSFPFLPDFLKKGHLSCFPEKLRCLFPNPGVLPKHNPPPPPPPPSHFSLPLYCVCCFIGGVRCGPDCCCQ